MGKFQSEFDAASAEDKAYAIAVHRAEQRKRAQAWKGVVLNKQLIGSIYLLKSTVRSYRYRLDKKLTTERNRSTNRLSECKTIVGRVTWRWETGAALVLQGDFRRPCGFVGQSFRLASSSRAF